MQNTRYAQKDYDICEEILDDLLPILADIDISDAIYQRFINTYCPYFIDGKFNEAQIALALLRKIFHQHPECSTKFNLAIKR